MTLAQMRKVSVSSTAPRFSDYSRHRRQITVFAFGRDQTIYFSLTESLDYYRMKQGVANV